MRVRGGGDAFCLATEKTGKRPRAHRFNVGWEDELNLDLFKAFNEIIDIATEDLFDRK